MENKTYNQSAECGPCDSYLDYVKQAELRAKEVVRAANEEIKSAEKQDIFFSKIKRCHKNSKYKFDFGALISEADTRELSKLHLDLEAIVGLPVTVSRMTRLFAKFALMHEEEVKAFAKEVIEEIW